jgi:pimeloyl-ACP methyl ester carboxylesterase
LLPPAAAVILTAATFCLAAPATRAASPAPPAAAHARATGAPHALTARASARLEARARAASGTTLSTCDDPPDTLCGSIDVPLDRRHPEAGTIPIFFAVVPHRAAGPAAGTILASEGGPGSSSTAAAGFYAWLFDPLLDRRDLLLIDLRGTGRSAAIDCPDLQHGIGDAEVARRACGEQLGASASLFGSADRAEDIEDVRAALGIPKLDYYGLSGGGLQVQAYAVRHGGRLRTAVLDAPYRAGVDDTFQSPTATALVRSAVLTCERSPSCHRADRNPRATLERLLARVRAQPVAGGALDADGAPHDVVVDEARVVDLLADTSGGYLDASEISAAARALAHGDRAPLLRMAAETEHPWFADQGDPRFYSDGDFVATFCTDGRFAWDKSAPEPARRAQYEAAVAGLRRSVLAPFSVPAWLGSHVTPGPDCLSWPQPSPAPPPVPAGARFPQVPALALSGDRDVAVPSENVRAVAERFPRGQFVSVAGAGHVTAFDSECAGGLIVRFIETAARVDARCAARFDPPYGVGHFTRRAGHRRRAVARAAWAAAYDAIQRAFRMGGDTGAGLRGGTFALAGDWPVVDLDYDRVRFASDVAVSGHAHVDFDEGGIAADLVVDGEVDGRLRIEGRLFPHTAPLTARGTLGGRPVAVLVPTA